MSEEPDLVAILRAQQDEFASTAERKKRELRGVSPKDRHALRTHGNPLREIQLNIRVTARFKQRVGAAANARKISITEMLVRAFEGYMALEDK